MVFRIKEETESARERAIHYLTEGLNRDVRPSSIQKLKELIDEHGPVVESYPSWHPMVNLKPDEFGTETIPSERCGYRGIDHTIFMRGGFITCPYAGDDAVIQSIEECDQSEALAHIEATRLDFPLYYENATPVLVTCESYDYIPGDGSIPTRSAVAMMLEKEIPSWRNASVGEHWEDMRPYFLGRPCGKVSSLFVSKETGQAIKRVWETLNSVGVFGPMR
ncbi:hypothetical protein VDG1235_3309 [Verrucomicrobiia bacterium DG1235]|nr:hypothetical protein VDG1235_3309 [Verrucomicrobiae bacterium DG1235]